MGGATKKEYKQRKIDIDVHQLAMNVAVLTEQVQEKNYLIEGQQKSIEDIRNSMDSFKDEIRGSINMVNTSVNMVNTKVHTMDVRLFKDNGETSIITQFRKNDEHLLVRIDDLEKEFLKHSTAADTKKENENEDKSFKRFAIPLSITSFFSMASLIIAMIVAIRG